MDRRTFLQMAVAGSAALAMPRFASGAGARTIRFVPYVDLLLLDPVATTATQKRLAAEVQTEMWREATFIPAGQIYQPVAYRSTLSGVLPGFVKFYNVEKGS